MPAKKTTIVGLTGGIATGESTVASILRQMKIPVICTDTLAHTLTKKQSPAIKEILQNFGPSVFNADKTLNRPALAKIVFEHPKKQTILEKILHPRIKKEVKRQIAKIVRATTGDCPYNKSIIHRRGGPPWPPKTIVLDVPLLFEAGWDKMCNQTICVTAPQKLQIERLKKYRKMTRKEALARIKAQMPLKEKVKRADVVIENESTKIALKYRVMKFLQKMTQ